MYAFVGNLPIFSIDFFGLQAPVLPPAPPQLDPDNDPVVLPDPGDTFTDLGPGAGTFGSFNNNVPKKNYIELPKLPTVSVTLKFPPLSAPNAGVSDIVWFCECYGTIDFYFNDTDRDKYLDALGKSNAPRNFIEDSGKALGLAGTLGKQEGSIGIGRSCSRAGAEFNARVNLRANLKVIADKRAVLFWVFEAFDEEKRPCKCDPAIPWDPPNR